MVKHVQFKCPLSHHTRSLNHHCTLSKSLHNFSNRKNKNSIEINKTNALSNCKKANKHFNKLMHNYGRMDAGTDCRHLEKKMNEANNPDKCTCLDNENVTPRVNLCGECGGHTFSGQTCADFPPNDITVNDDSDQCENEKVTCCPCRIDPATAEMKQKAAVERVEKNNPLIGGPFADKLASIFLPGNKGKLPAIVGYHSDGSPIYGPPGGASNITGYNADGTPIYLPGTGGATDKTLIMGYRKDGTPIHPPPSSNPKESMAIIGTYIKDGSPIIGNIKLAGGMVVKGSGKDGCPTYVQLSGSGNTGSGGGASTGGPALTKVSSDDNRPTSGKTKGKKGKGKKEKPDHKDNKKAEGNKKGTPISRPSVVPPPVTPPKKLDKKGTAGDAAKDEKKEKEKATEDLISSYQRLDKNSKAYKNLMQSLENFYPRCKYHSTCLKERNLLPKNRGWKWENRVDVCTVETLPYWFPPCYQPGAVPKRIAKEIEMKRNCNICPKNKKCKHVNGNRTISSCTNCALYVPSKKIRPQICT